jgi:hypothetical protein
MKEKHNTPPSEKKAAQQAIIKKVASKLKNRVLFPEKVAYAKELLNLVNATEAKAKNV